MSSHGSTPRPSDCKLLSVVVINLEFGIIGSSGGLESLVRSCGDMWVP